MSEDTLNAKIVNANNGFYYILLKGDEVTSQKRYISGAFGIWKKDDSYVMAPSYRLCGLREDIENAFEQIEAPSTNRVLYSAKMSTKTKARFDAELEEYEQHMEDSKQDRYLSDEQYDEILSGIGSFKFYKKEAEHRSTFKNPVGRYNELKEGEYLDVSNRREDGSGSLKKTDIPPSRSLGSTKIRIISNNVETYRAELEAIGLWTPSQINGAVSALKKNLESKTSNRKTKTKLTTGVKSV